MHEPGTLPVEVRRLDPDLPLPAYARDGDAGLDLHARKPFMVRRGDRVAQRVENVSLVEVDFLPDSERGEAGHGASGGFVQPASTE